MLAREVKGAERLGEGEAAFLAGLARHPLERGARGLGGNCEACSQISAIFSSKTPAMSTQVSASPVGPSQTSWTTCGCRPSAISSGKMLAFLTAG